MKKSTISNKGMMKLLMTMLFHFPIFNRNSLGTRNITNISTKTTMKDKELTLERVSR